LKGRPSCFAAVAVVMSLAYYWLRQWNNKTSLFFLFSSIFPFSYLLFLLKKSTQLFFFIAMSKVVIDVIERTNEYSDFIKDLKTFHAHKG
jgi:Na+/melibiose symporter-like transporter